MLVLALIVTAAAAVVLGQAAARQCRVDDPEREAMRSVGYTRGQVPAELSSRAALVGIAGGAGSVALAILHPIASRPASSGPSSPTPAGPWTSWPTDLDWSGWSPC